LDKCMTRYVDMKSPMMLAYQFRLYPNKAEERKLLWAKELCRQTYDRFLELYNGGNMTVERSKPCFLYGKGMKRT
jgi:hypothetical protein